MAKAKTKPAPEKVSIQNRIVGSDIVAAADLRRNPKNWRKHPEHQVQALTGVLESVGYVQEIIVNKRTGVLIDGHARVDIAAARGESIPVKYVDLSEAEENLILATFDPISAMAETDTDMLATLLEDVNSDNAAVQQMLAGIAEREGIVPPDVEFPEYTEDVEKDVKYCECPNCGHKFPK